MHRAQSLAVAVDCSCNVLIAWILYLSQCARQYWHNELLVKMNELSLPSPPSTNTHLNTCQRASLIRYNINAKILGILGGVNPGYGINMQDGFQDTFNTCAGARSRCKKIALIDNQFRHYVRDDGTPTIKKLHKVLEC